MRALLVLLASAATANAAPCDDRIRLTAGLDALSDLAANEAVKNPWIDHLDPCLEKLDHAQRKQLAAACKVILARDPKHRVCVIGEVAIESPRAFDLLSAWDQSPWGGPTFVEGGSERVVAMYEQLGDPRGLEVVRETWRSSIGEAARRGGEPGWRGKQALAVWRRWRVQAARLFGARGGRTAIEMLRGEAKSGDPVVARACGDAIRAIEKRGP